MDRSLRIRMLLEASERVTKPLREIANGSGRTAQALKATRDRLKELNAAQADIGGFRELKQGVRTTETALGEAQQRVTALARAMQATENPTKRMVADFAKAKREATGLKAEHTDQSIRLQVLRDRLSVAGISTSNLGQHERRLRGDIAATNVEIAEQTQRLRQADDRARRFAAGREKFGRMQNAATGMAASGFSGIQTGQAMLRPIMGSVEDSDRFESGMTDIAQKADLTRRAAAGMSAELLRAARAANQLPDDLQRGVDALSGFGLDPTKAVTMMQPIGRAATAYKAAIDDLSKAAFAANDNLKVPIDQTGRVIDIMAVAGKRGAFEVKDMAEYFPALTAAYQGLGQSGTGAVADLAAALQIARKGAGDAASAGTNLTNVLQKINAPATVRAFQKMGVDLPAALKKMYAEGKTPIEAIAELTNKTLKGDLSRIGFLFEDAQVQQGLRPLIQNLKEYRDIRADAGKANGTTDRDFAERLRDSAEKAKRLQVQASVLSVTLGAKMAPAVNAVRGKLADAAEWTTRFAQRHPTLTKAVLLGTAVLAGMFVVLGGGAIALAAIMAPIAIINAGLVAMGVAGGAASIGLLPIIGTVLLIVAAIAALAAVAYLIYANWGKITAWFAGLWEGVKAIFNGVMAWFAGLPGRFAGFGRNMIAGLIGGITGMLGQLKSTIVSAASSAAAWFKQKLGIHSPSRVFMGLGGFIMQGLDRGIANGQNALVDRLSVLSARMQRALDVQGRAPPVNAQTNRLETLAKQVAVALAIGAPSAASASDRSFLPPVGRQEAAPGRYGGDRYEIHLHAAPGMDEAKLMDLLERKLEEIERRKSAGRRSSFLDMPDYGDRA